MTPEQLDHLTKLKAHLESLLATAAKRTPGEWEVRDHSEVVVGGSSITELAASDRFLHEDEGNAKGREAEKKDAPGP